MQTIEQALEEVRALHEQLTHSPAPRLDPHFFLPFPPGVDPVSFAIQEVAQLKEMVEAQRTVPNAPADFVPPLGIYVGDSEVIYTLDLPGVSREHVSVTLVGREIVVRGQRAPRPANPQLQPRVLEQAWGSFDRRLPVPPWCVAERIKARCSDGVMEIRITRGEDDRSGEIQVPIQ